MSYVRFALRCCLIFIPGCFLLLYLGAHLPFKLAFLWALAVPVCGFLLLSPLIVGFNSMDRTLWSRQTELERRRRRLEYLEKLRQEEYGEE